MKRTTEFVLGLVGSIIATVINAFFVIVIGFMPVTWDVGEAWGYFWIALAFSITSIVFSCLVNKKTKLSGIMMIILSILIGFFNIWSLIPSILLLIAGIMCLARKLPTQNDSK